MVPPVATTFTAPSQFVSSHGQGAQSIGRIDIHVPTANLLQIPPTGTTTD